MAIYHEDIVDIELESGNIHRSFAKHSIGSGDAAANRFGVRVLRAGVAVALAGVVCQGYFRNANGENIALTSHGTIAGNVAYVTLPQACYNVEGNFTLSLKLVGGGVTGTMRIVDGVVDNTGTTGAVAPTGSVPTYQEVLAVYEEMVDTVEHVDGEINGMKQALNPTMWGGISQFKFQNLLKGRTPKVGYYVNYETGEEAPVENWQYYIVPSPGEYLIAVGGGNTHVAFFDEAGEYIGGENPTWQTNYSCSIPAGCAFFAYSTSVEDDQYIVIRSEAPERAENNSPVARLGAVHVDIGNMPDIVKPRKNLFNKFAAYPGGFIDYYSKGSFTANENFYYCPWFIPAEPETTYCPNGACIIAEYDADYNWIKVNNMSALVNVQPFTTDEDCRYVRISCADLNNYQLEKGSNRTAYAPFQMTFVGDDATEAETRTIIVDANGGGNYTTISAACAAANDGDTIYIRDGVYYESVKINGLNVHLVGESREGTILKYLGTQYANPPLEMSSGSIENMTIWAITEQGATGGGGYCLHCDNELSANKSLTCRNVKFQNDYYQTIGIGLQPHFVLSFENCEIIGQFYVHDSAKTFIDLTGQVLRVIDCTITANGEPLGAIRMQSQERSGAEATAVFQRCIVKNTGSNVIVHMGLWEDPGLAKDGWLGSTDWHLSGLSALNNASILNAE